MDNFKVGQRVIFTPKEEWNELPSYMQPFMYNSLRFPPEGGIISRCWPDEDQYTVAHEDAPWMIIDIFHSSMLRAL